MSNITIVGGRSTGTAVAADMITRGHTVTMFEQESYGAHMREIQQIGEIRQVGFGPQGAVKAPRITFDPAEAFADAEIIFMAIVANRHREVCSLIAPYLKDGQVVCFFSGNCGSMILKPMLGGKDILVGETMGSYNSTRYLGEAKIFHANPVAPSKFVVAFPAKDNQRFVEALSPVYPCTCYPNAPVKNAIECALNSPNVTNHLISSILNISAMEHSHDFRLYRDGMTPSVVKLIDCVRQERQAVMEGFGYTHNVMNVVAIMKAMMNFDEAPIPDKAGFRLTTGPDCITHRYISEDAFAGDSLMVSMGKLLGVETPVISAAVTLASHLNDCDYYKEGLTLENLGLSRYSVDEINHYLETGELPG